ncbi:transporter substrate-binding domain-containing protein [Lacisediminihabitans profunda]|uniref:Transporter substrate-binding domain-containing protein n=1 Tax=Lacisediminihabitans profunda TaxID=2594790 RepID=A0A5C8UQQ6_9MICO|nr:transporter substrate-binding domain-containing protein [Lacisediminihabitans profunda]TXN29799.1 transporter substrate-binding domain-containing protein [Lacisediminihabitans profunda]
MRSRFITIPLALVVTGAFALTGCSAQPSKSSSSGSQTGAPTPAALTDIPTKVISTKIDPKLAAKLPSGFGDTLTVAIDLSSPPARLVDKDGKPAGFDADFTNLLAEKLGLKAKIVNVPLAQIVPGLAAKRYDLSINNLSRNPEREAQLDMVEYMQGSAGIAIPAANPKKVNGKPESLCGLKLAVLSGSYQETTQIPQINTACAAAGKPAATPTAYGTNNEAILALGSKRQDAWIGNGTVSAYAAAQNPQVFKSLTLTDSWSHDNIGLPKGSALTDVVAEAFQSLMDDGSYEQVLEKWGIPKYALDKTSLTQTTVVQQD